MLLWMPFLLVLLQNTAVTDCTWGTPVEIGALDSVVNESSGLAVSRRFPNRAYTHNDSGDTGRFFVMDLSGANLQVVNIAGFSPLDNEDMALGPCGESTDCIFIGDIGDNDSRRMNLELVVVEERADFPDEIRPAYRVRMRYPDGPHDAESLGVDPKGNVYIVTKDAARSQIYRLTPDQWGRTGNPVETLEPVVTLDWQALQPNTLPFARMATGMDIAPDGQRFLILTYTGAMEFFIDLSATVPDPGSWQEGSHYRKVRLTTLEQQEGIAYLPDGRSFLYDTERPQNAVSARILRVDCGN